MKSFFLLAAFTVAAWAAKQPFSSSDIFELRRVGDPQISRDGKSVLYSVQWADKMNDAFYTNIWLADTSSGAQRPITQGNFKDSSPRWSPDQTRIAYLSNRSGKVQLWVRWMDSGQEAQITNLEQAPSAITWSPDGKWIAYVARVPAKPAFSISMPEKPTGSKWAEPPIVVTELNWRVDGSGVTPPGFTHVFIIPATGGAPRQISSGDYNHSGELGGDGIDWTGDGKWILASTQRIPDADYSLEGPDIFAYSVADGAVKQLTNRKGPDTEPHVSPDGNKIAYLGSEWKFQSYTVTNLYVMNVDGSNQ